VSIVLPPHFSSQFHPLVKDMMETSLSSEEQVYRTKSKISELKTKIMQLKFQCDLCKEVGE
jgi:hypothetical protein